MPGEEDMNGNRTLYCWCIVLSVLQLAVHHGCKDEYVREWKGCAESCLSLPSLLRTTPEKKELTPLEQQRAYLAKRDGEIGKLIVGSWQKVRENCGDDGEYTDNSSMVIGGETYIFTAGWISYTKSYPDQKSAYRIFRGGLFFDHHFIKGRKRQRFHRTYIIRMINERMLVMGIELCENNSGEYREVLRDGDVSLFAIKCGGEGTITWMRFDRR